MAPQLTAHLFVYLMPLEFKVNHNSIRWRSCHLSSFVLFLLFNIVHQGLHKSGQVWREEDNNDQSNQIDQSINSLTNN